MSWKKLLLAGLCGMAMASTALAHGGLSIGIGVGLPIYPRPWCGPYGGPYYYPGYYYRPVYYAAPVVVQPAPVLVPQPVVVQPAPVVQQGPAPSGPPPANTVISTFQPADLKKTGDIGPLLQLLNDPDEKIRSESVIQLGRLKADAAVDPLCATLAGDKSPLVRDSAAKALGLIGASRSLTALIHASKADSDNDVRHSAQFAVEIIKVNQNLK